MNVVVNGLMTNYSKIGSGKVVVLLHGWADNSSTFKSLVDELKDYYTLLMVDLPGFGSTEAPPSGWGLDEYVEFVKNWLMKIGAPEVYAFIGHSYGGAVAIRALGSGQLSASKLVLVASAGIRHGRSLRKKIMKAAAKTAKLPLYVLPPSQRKRVKNRAYKAIGSDMTLLPHMEDTFKKIITQDVADDAEAIKIPTLLIYGSADTQTPVSDGRVFNARIAGSRLEIVDGADHFVHQNSPEIAAKIKSFLGDRT